MTTILIKEKHLIGVDLQFRDLVYYHHGGMQADTVLEKELRVLHLDPQAAERRLCATPGTAWVYETSKSTPTVTYFLQQGNTYFNKAIPPNSAMPYGPSIQTSLWGPFLFTPPFGLPDGRTVVCGLDGRILLRHAGLWKSCWWLPAGGIFFSIN